MKSSRFKIVHQESFNDGNFENDVEVNKNISFNLNKLPF